MKKRYEKINLNGEFFTLDTKVTIPYPTTFIQRGVNDVYSRPSTAKQNIWFDWSDWFMSNNGFCTVSSYNSNFFTIEGKVEDMATGEKYWCYITHANKRCYKLV